MAKYGFVEEASRPGGRSRPWRITDLGFTIARDDQGVASPAEALRNVLIQAQVDRSFRWAREAPAAAEPWQDFGGQSETVIWLTRAEAAQLDEELAHLLNRFPGRLQNRASRPEGAQPIEVVVLTHPFSGDVSGNGPGEGGSSRGVGPEGEP